MTVITLHKSYYSVWFVVDQIVTFQNPFNRPGETLIRLQTGWEDGIIETPEQIKALIYKAQCEFKS
jgi:hypothetical protein